MCEFKSNPEDFIVDEILFNGVKVSSINSSWLNDEGPFVWVAVKKTLRNTMDVAKDFARVSGLTLKRINYGGIKDRVSISYQVFSLNYRDDLHNLREKLANVKGIEILAMTHYNRWIKSSDILGNSFRIRLRNCVREVDSYTEFPNYFGKQRFGSIQSNSAEVGHLLIKGDYDNALKVYFGRDFDGDPMKFIHSNKRTFQFMIHAFQSKLFNEELKMRIEENAMGVLPGEYKCGVNDYGFPQLDLEGNKFVVTELIGWKLRNPNRFKEYLLDKYELNLDMFKRWDVKGGWRTLMAPLVNFNFSKEDRDLIFSFDLPRGSYATEALNALVKGLDL